MFPLLNLKSMHINPVYWSLITDRSLKGMCATKDYNLLIEWMSTKFFETILEVEKYIDRYVKMCVCILIL